MQKSWHFIVGAPKKLWALYKQPQSEKTEAWNSDLLGHVERQDDGTWSAFGPHLDRPCTFLSNEPNKEYAMKEVEKAISI